MTANKMTPITPITPAMQKAWVEYDSPDSFTADKDMKPLRVAGLMRHAFMSGFEAGEAHNQLECCKSQLELLRRFYDFAEAALNDKTAPGFGYPPGSLQELKALFGPYDAREGG